MNRATQRQLAEQFRALHYEQNPEPLVLPNAWDAVSAVLLEAAGFDAVATTSHGVAASYGYPDGTYLTGEEMADIVERVARAVSVPTSADIEAGYGDTPEEVGETVEAILEAGAIGVNIEDGTDDPDTPLVDVDQHVETIAAARRVADAIDIPLVINGRTDVFWLGVGDPESRIDRAIERANQYYAAGSDCLFVPGVRDASVIESLVDGLDGPLNVIGGPGVPTIDELGELGVARVSVGSGLLRTSLARLQDAAKELHEDGTYHAMDDWMEYDELTEMLTSSVQQRSN